MSQLQFDITEFLLKNKTLIYVSLTIELEEFHKITKCFKDYPELYNDLKNEFQLKWLKRYLCDELNLHYEEICLNLDDEFVKVNILND